jgi:hypothetical protein
MASEKWHDINSPGFAKFSKSEESAREKEADAVEVQPVAVAPQQDAEVRIISGRWVAGKDGFQFNNKCTAEVTCEILKETIKKKLSIKLFVNYNNNIEDLNHQVDAFIGKDNIGRADLTLYYGDSFYADYSKDPQKKCTYFFKATHSQGSTIQSDDLEMPCDSPKSGPQPDLPEVNGWWLSKEPVSPVDGIAGDTPCISMLAMEDALYRHDSAVFLPDIIRDSYADPEFQATPGDDPDLRHVAQNLSEGLYMIAQVLVEIRSQETIDTCLIAGHTDTSGDASYNTNLSKYRAESVYYIIDGTPESREKWGAQFKEEYYKGTHVRTVKDLQQILAWIAVVRGWPCSPGAIDGKQGEKTTEAVRAFQESYSSCGEFEPIAVDGVAKKETWMAFFDVYQSQLALLLDCTPESLNQIYRSCDNWKSLFTMCGCGEKWPIQEANRDNYRSATNRRVEVLIFPKDSGTTLACSDAGCVGGGCTVYSPLPDGSPRYTFSRMFVDLPPPEQADPLVE